MAGVQVLVVEDNISQANLVKFLLEEAGQTVQVAENAEKAFEVLQTFVPDLILVDVQLAGQDGLEFAVELRLNPVYGATPIIALTACFDPSDLAKAREAGCNGNISKPIDTVSFARQVRNYLSGINSADADVPADNGDVLSEIRNHFIAEGVGQCDALLKMLESSPGSAVSIMRRMVYRWAAVGGTLGFPEISKYARGLEALLASNGLASTDMLRATATARRRFYAAARTELELPVELLKGLLGVRLGLVNFSVQETNRIRSAATRAKVEVVIEQLDGESIADQKAYSALIINECALSAHAALHRSKWSVPTVFIGSRGSLESLSKLPLRGCDFVIGPWEAEELLMRVCRLLARTGPLLPVETSSNVQKRRPRVLVADDDPDLVSLVTETLKHFGMDCDIARNGKQALDAARQHRPDAIVLDVNMVDLDGFEILKKLRNNPATEAIPVLLLTARSQESDITRGFESGANDYVVKPFQPWDLAKRLDRIISALLQPSALRASTAPPDGASRLPQ
jgi:DNA-binding response OmpR family regulator